MSGLPSFLSKTPPRRIYTGYLVAVAVVALSTVAAIATQPFSQRAPFLLYFPSILIVLWYGGLRPAVVTTLLSAVSVHFYLTKPSLEFFPTMRDLSIELVFVVILITTSWLLERDRNRKDAASRLQYKLLQLAIESTLITDPAHRITAWHPGAERMYGWKAKEAIGKIPGQILHTIYLDQPDDLESIDRQLRQTGHWQGRLARQGKDGHLITTLSSWAMDPDTGCILQCDLDVSEKARYAEELRQLNFALRALSGVNQAIVHSAEEDEVLQATVKILVEEGGFELAWIGTPEDDAQRSIRVRAISGIVASHFSHMNFSWGDDPSGRCLAGRVLHGEGVCVICDLLTEPSLAPWRDFTRQHGLHSAIALPIVIDSRPAAVLLVYSVRVGAFTSRLQNLLSELAADISYGVQSIRHRKAMAAERKTRELLEEQLRQAQKLESIGRLAGGISHDFNNLLMVISSQTEMLSLQLSGKPLERAKRVLQAANRAAELTGQLLAFSRKQIFQPLTTTMDDILAGFVEMIKRLVGEDIEVTTILAGDPWPVKADRAQMEQVIMNLAINARDAMPQGGKLKLESANCNLSTEYIATHPTVKPGRYVMLAVTDTGVGMSEETKVHIFEPFFTTKERGKGTGLGLAMVYGIVQQNGGFIWFYSELGQGTCFKIYLPAAEQEAAVSMAVAAPTAAGEPAKARVATVLLVEDDNNLREVVSEFLSSAGHQVIPVESRAAALEYAGRNHGSFDLLLTDVILQDGSGRDLAEAILSIHNHVRVIYMSGYTPNAIVHHGILEEMTMFLQKPFTREALLAKVTACLGG
jgi:PAS domain S-box-containing protein